MTEQPLVCPSCASTHSLDERFCPSCGMPLVYAGATGVDKPVTAFLVAHRTSTWTAIFSVLTDLGGVAVLAPVTGLLAAVILYLVVLSSLHRFT